tara:strand:- start:3985 stop:6714 length:2730 start_codon:yes stop_codon:yes gene_type:complete
MNDVYNRKMFVKGFKGGSSIRSEPRGAGPTSVYDSNPFKPILGFDFLSGVTSGYTTSRDEFKKGTTPYAALGIMDQFKNTFRASPDYYGDMFNYLLAPFGEASKVIGTEFGTAFFGLDRGKVNTEFGSFPRFRTENNPYGFPSQLGTNPAEFFRENFPPGSQERLDFLLQATLRPNFQRDLATIGVTAAEIKAAENYRVNKFNEARERGLDPDLLTERGFDPEKVKPVYDFPEEELKLDEPFKDVKTGDLSLMESIAKEGPFPQPQLDLKRGSESPFRVDKRTKDLINLLGGGEGQTNEEVVDGEKKEVLDSETAGDGAGSEANFANKNEKQNNIAAAEEGAFDFEKEVERFKDILRESTDVKDTTTPALLLLQLASNLVSGRTNEKGFAGFLDVLGQASGPVLDSAVKLAQDRNALEKEIGATAVSMAFEKEKDLLDRAATVAANQAKLNENFNTTKYLRKKNFAPNGAILSYSPDFVAVDSLEEFEKLNAIQPIELENGQVIMARPFAMFDDQSATPFYYGVRNQETFFKEALPVMNRHLRTINFITAIQGEDIVDQETGAALVGPKALLSLSLAKGADFISALTNNVDTKQLFSKQQAADFALAFSEIDMLDTGGDEDVKIKMKQNLLFQSQGIDLDGELINALNQELYTANAFEGFSINDILTNPGAVDEYMKQKGLTASSTLPVSNQFGVETMVPIGDIKKDAQDTFNFLVQAAAEEGIEFVDGKFVRPEPTDLEKYTFTIAGKQFSVNPKVFQLGLKSKILGIMFARFQQPEQRLLKDTIESSIGEFSFSSILTGPQELNSKLQEFKEGSIRQYNSLVQENFQTEAEGVFDLYKWQPNKVSVFKTPIQNGVPVASVNGQINAQTTVPSEKIQENDLQSTGQNHNQKVKYYDLMSILDKYDIRY